MLLNKADGSINTFLTIQTVKTYTSTPKTSTYSAFFYEEKDPLDGKAYFYVAFLATTGTVAHIMKFENNAKLSVIWHFSYSTTSGT
jgi:hypothetical protein